MILLPPPPYDHPYTGPVTVIELSAPDVAIACGNPDAQACVYLKAPGGPMMILPKIGPGGVSARTRDLLRRHENGHLNAGVMGHEGWK
jgi:hypothetical protein